MPAGERASLKALANSKTFTGPYAITVGYQEIWNPNVQDEPWFNIFSNWFISKTDEFEICEIDGNPITLVVV